LTMAHLSPSVDRDRRPWRNSLLTAVHAAPTVDRQLRGQILNRPTPD